MATNGRAFSTAVQLWMGILVLMISLVNASVIHSLQSHMKIPQWTTPCEFILSRSESAYMYTPTEWITPFAETARGRLGAAFAETLVQQIFGIAAKFCARPSAPPGFPTTGNGLWYTTPATNWATQYLPVGNGYLGATTPGGSALEVTPLNIDALWSGGPFEDPNYNGGNKQPYEQAAMAAALEQIRHTIFTSDTGTIDNIEVLSTDAGAYGSNVVAATLVNEVNVTGPISDYYRWLDMDIGVHRTLWTQGGATYRRDLFCSHPVKACVQHLGSTSTLPNITYTFVGYLSLPPITSNCYNNNTLQVQGSAGSPGMIWEILATVQASGKGASVSCTALNSTTSVITVGGAEEAWITWVGGTDYDMNAGDAAHQFSFRGPDPHDTLTSLIQSSSNKAYLNLFKEHVQDYSSIMSSFSLDLGQKANLDASTDSIVHAYRRDIGDSYLEWILFNYGRYLLTASSRGTLPANLQGGWVIDSSAWSADYHANINVQMNYWFAELTNMDVTQPLWDYMEKTWAPRGHYTAQVLYNTSRGWVTHNEMNIFGHTGMKLNGNSAIYADYPAANAWMAFHIWDHFDYTNDVDWWKRQGYPLLKGIALFHLDNLRPDLRSNDTELTIVPCNSPEQPQITYSCAHFQQAIWQVFNSIEKGFEAAGDTDTMFLEDVIIKRQLMDKGVRTGWWGELMEWKAGLDSSTDTHRHLSHLVGLYPGYAVLSYDPSLQPVHVNGSLVNYTRDDVLKAAEVSLIHRGDGLGYDGDTGWGKVWRAACWASLRQPARFYDELSFAVFENFAENLFSVFYSNPIFQIDANFGYSAALLNGLIQVPDTPTLSSPLTVTLLPALPADKWPNGNIRGARIRSGLLIDFWWNRGVLSDVYIRKASSDASWASLAGGQGNGRQVVLVNGQTGKTISSFWSNKVRGQMTFRT